jgi:hypothetical protein
MADDEQLEQRSASATIIQGVAASGALLPGAGHLAEGVAKVKDSFGGGSQEAPPPADPPQQPKED